MFLHELHYLLLMGFSHSNRTIVRRTGALGLLPGQPKILEALTAYDGCTQKELAQVCALDKSTVTSVLSRMVAQGLVRKEACADDRRAARIYLMDVTETDTGLSVRYGYSLNGAEVSLSGGDSAALFTIQDGQITAFTLRFRRYEDAGQTSLVLNERMAAAALEALDPEGRELVLCYSDSGGDTVQAGWVAK